MNNQGSKKTENSKPQWKMFVFANYAEAKSQLDDITDAAIQQWFGDSLARTRNRTLAVAHDAQSDHRLNGTLSLDMDPDKRENNLLVHYYVNRNRLILIGDTNVALTRINQAGLNELMRACETPIDALIVLLSEILEFFFLESDRFEQSLHALEEEMRSRNDKQILKRTINLRNDLTYWNAQIIPIKEIRYAAEEVFRQDLESSDCQAVLELRLKRIEMLQHEYNKEIDSLLRVDENITNYRANDIMKALTLYTVLLTPTTALGAIWGMNFEHMPELSWQLGYAFALVVILASTGATYWWLKQRGLTADILSMDTGRKSKRGRGNEEIEK